MKRLPSVLVVWAAVLVGLVITASPSNALDPCYQVCNCRRSCNLTCYSAAEQADITCGQYTICNGQCTLAAAAGPFSEPQPPFQLFQEPTISPAAISPAQDWTPASSQ
jgi:hypothetical protein